MVSPMELQKGHFSVMMANGMNWSIQMLQRRGKIVDSEYFAKNNRMIFLLIWCPTAPITVFVYQIHVYVHQLNCNQILWLFCMDCFILQKSRLLRAGAFMPLLDNCFRASIDLLLSSSSNTGWLIFPLFNISCLILFHFSFQGWM